MAVLAAEAGAAAHWTAATATACGGRGGDSRPSSFLAVAAVE